MMADVVTLPVLGRLPLAACAVCGRDVIQSGQRRRRCFRCVGVHTTQGGRATSPLGGRLGGGMHLALVHPVRESSVRELAPQSIGPVASWGESASASRLSPVKRTALGFEAELGQRLEAALALVEERVEVLELCDVGLRRAVDALVAELPDGVRAPAIVPLAIAPLTSVPRPPLVDLPHDDKSGPAIAPWTAFVEHPERPSADEIAAAALERERRLPRPLTPAFTMAERDARRARLRAAPAVGSPPVAVATEEEAMGSRPVFYEYEGKQLRAAELAALPQAVKAGLDRNCIHLRLQGGWPIELAISSPKGTPRPGARSSSKPPPAPKTTAKKRAAPKPRPASLVDDVRATVTATVSLLDPVSLLERLGVAHELVGRTPRGRLVLFVEAADAQ